MVKKKTKVKSKVNWKRKHDEIVDTLHEVREVRDAAARRANNLDTNAERYGLAIIGLVFLLIASGLILPNLDGQVDEDAFCKAKLEKHFPEYKFYQAIHTIGEADSQYCRGYYYPEHEIRDGLKDIGEISDNDYSTRKFELLSIKEKELLNSDDTGNALILGGVLPAVLGIALLLGSIFYDV